MKENCSLIPPTLLKHIYIIWNKSNFLFQLTALKNILKLV